ncbi:MAG: IS110 family transposase [Solirubrobacteraceae bacterium]
MGNVAGIDWASEQHDVRVSDGAGEKLLAATYAHDEAGLSSLCKVLTRLRVELCQRSREFLTCDHGNSPPLERVERAGRMALIASRWRRIR